MQIPGEFECQGLTCYPTGEDPNSYHVYPGDPQPEVDPSGHPALMSIPLPQGGFLQLGVHLGPGDEAIEELRRELARELAEPGLIRLAMAPLSVDAVRLMIGGGAGSPTEVARSSSSGYPPYIALFHLQIDAQQQDSVAAALNGRLGFLQIQYDLIVELPVTAIARLSGNVGPILTGLPEPGLDVDPTPLLCARIVQEIEAGRLLMEVEATELAPDELCERVRALAIDHAAEMMAAVWRGESTLADAADAEITASMSEPLATPMTRATDVATWFRVGAGPDHLVLPPGAGPTTAPKK